VLLVPELTSVGAAEQRCHVHSNHLEVFRIAVSVLLDVPEIVEDAIHRERSANSNEKSSEEGITKVQFFRTPAVFLRDVLEVLRITNHASLNFLRLSFMVSFVGHPSLSPRHCRPDFACHSAFLIGVRESSLILLC